MLQNRDSRCTGRLTRSTIKRPLTLLFSEIMGHTLGASIAVLRRVTNPFKRLGGLPPASFTSHESPPSQV